MKVEATKQQAWVQIGEGGTKRFSVLLRPDGRYDIQGAVMPMTFTEMCELQDLLRVVIIDTCDEHTKPA